MLVLKSIKCDDNSASLRVSMRGTLKRTQYEMILVGDFHRKNSK